MLGGYDGFSSRYDGCFRVREKSSGWELLGDDGDGDEDGEVIYILYKEEWRLG